MFEVTHMGFSQQRGSFGITTGKVTLDRAAKKGSDRRFHRDPHRWRRRRRSCNLVKSDDFLNVEKFPTMTYKSADLVFDGDNLVGANGEFTMLGVTRPVALKVTSFKCGPNPFNKKPMCGGEATAYDQAFGIRDEGRDGCGERRCPSHHRVRRRQGIEATPSGVLDRAAAHG